MSNAHDSPFHVLQHACDAHLCRTGLARRTMAATTVDSVISSSESTKCLHLDDSFYPKLSTLNPKRVLTRVLSGIGLAGV